MSENKVCASIKQSTVLQKAPQCEEVAVKLQQPNTFMQHF